MAKFLRQLLQQSRTDTTHLKQTQVLLRTDYLKYYRKLYIIWREGSVGKPD